MTTIDNLMQELGFREKQELTREQSKFLNSSGKILGELAAKIETKASDIEETKKQLLTTYRPNGQGGFPEADGFEGFISLQFFYEMARLLDRAFSPTLTRLPRLQQTARNIPSAANKERVGLMDLLNQEKDLGSAIQEVCEIKKQSILFEQVVKHVYQRAVDQHRYLQKRFLNVGGDDSRTYRNPWEEDQRKGGFDFARIPYVKIELVKDNALLTDLLLDISEQLPREYTRKEKVKGKRKPKEVKFLDEFEVDRTTRVLIELADLKYQGYIRTPQEFLGKISRSIGSYYEIVSALEPHLQDFLVELINSPLHTTNFDTEIVRKSMPDPSSIIARLTGMNYNSIRPNEEDVRPSSQIERRYFAARKTLLEHLAQSIEAIEKTDAYADKFEIAKNAVEKGIKLKEKMREALETRQIIKLRKDKKTENEFYVGTAQGHGEFTFEREAAPTVKLRDVRGKSFDVMKQHLADLADYSKYLNLYGATAPRGKIRSNIVAIGPYGCGKTEIGRAIAGDPRFIGAEVSVTDLLTCWFGEFEKNVDRVWDSAQELRRNSGDGKLVFLIMDEFDSWFNSSNGHWVDNTYSRVQKAIQMKLDGVVDYEGIMVVGMTNEPKKIPLAIYRRFKYVDIVGELDAPERADLLKMFLSNGLPLSRGFRASDYQRWGESLEGATGDVIGKVADDIHYEFMRKFIHEHPTEGRKLNNYIARVQSKNGQELDKRHVKRTMGQYMLVTPDWVEEKVQAKLAEPIIREQIETSRRVYAEARDVLANLHTRKDAASGNVIQSCEVPDLKNEY